MEFRFLSVKNKLFWDATFSGGSFLAAFCQGIILANLIEGVQPRLKGITADPLYFITPFTVCTGLIVIMLYALIGASWLNLKTEKELQPRFKKIAKGILILAAIFSALLYWLRANLNSFTPRFHYPALLPVSPLVWITGALILVICLYVALSSKRDNLPFIFNIVIMLYLAVWVATHIWPYIIPPYVNIYNAGSPLYGNRILLISTLIIIPVILCYLFYSYYVFRGKTITDNNYDPVWTADQVSLHHHGTKPPVPLQRQITLSWPLKLLLVIFWFIVFFTVLGFLGDHAAIFSIGLLIITFVIFWYRAARKENSADE